MRILWLLFPPLMLPPSPGLADHNLNQGPNPNLNHLQPHAETQLFDWWSLLVAHSLGVDSAYSSYQGKESQLNLNHTIFNEWQSLW